MKIFGYTIPQVYKAIAGFFTPGVIALGVAISTESPGGSSVTPAEMIGIATAMLVTGGLVFMVPPSPAKSTSVEASLPPGGTRYVGPGSPIYDQLSEEREPI